MTTCFLGIDSGTQSTKALLVDERGGVLGRGQSAYGLIEGLPPGHLEQHPRVWIDALIAAVQSALADANVDPQTVAAIGVSGQQHGCVPLDAAGEVIRPAKLWCDTATAAECEQILQAVGGPQQCVELTGNGVPAGFTASKILYLKNREPENYGRLATVLLPHDYLNFWLSGERRMEWGDASGTALLDVRTRRWRRELLEAIDPALEQKLPPLFHSAEPCGVLQSSAARALGLPAGVLISAGGGDNMMGAIGTGNVRPGVVSVSLGTSGTIYAFSSKPVIDPRGEIAAFCDSTGHWLPLLCTMNVTVATEQMKALFELSTEELNALAGQAAPGAQGLLLLPYFQGERVPNLPDAGAVLFGLNMRNAVPANFVRAAMEGATLGLNYGLNRLRELGIRPGELRLTGGGSKSAVWRQLLADVFQTPVVCTREAEGAALGAAAQACWCRRRRNEPALEIAAVTGQWVQLDPATRCEPDSGRAGLYQELQRLHDRLATELRGCFREHRRIFHAG